MASSCKKTDKEFMAMALREAIKAEGRTSPNPLVGAVIVKDGNVISKGYHHKAGDFHAEVNAINNASDTVGATIYVTLEPCNHQGRTPPCTKAILAAGLKRVVVGMEDPNPLVGGSGNKFLQENGLEVICGILEDECRRINNPFIKWIQTGMPWVMLKAGLTLDGKIAMKSGKGGWITNEKSRNYVHRIRDKADAILIGIDTAIIDNPSLTTRLSGHEHRDPLRVILDSGLRLSTDAKMLHQDSKAGTIIFCGPDYDLHKKKQLEDIGAEVISTKLGDDGHIDLEMVLKALGDRQITSLLVEGGSKVHAGFIKRDLADQIFLFFGPMLLGGDGLSAVGSLDIDRLDQAKRLKNILTHRFDDDVMIEGYFS